MSCFTRAIGHGDQVLSTVHSFSQQELYSGSLQEFLVKSKAAFRLADGSKAIHVVMGNQSGDMDSICCAIARALHLAFELGEGKVVVPLINFVQEDLALRRDVLLLLDTMNLNAADLLFLDEADSLEQWALESNLTLHLVDHNHLAPQQAKWECCVRTVIDHHVKEDRVHPLDFEKIQTCGSASTLVAEEILRERPGLLTPQLAKILLAPLLLDTANLKHPKKTTEKDLIVADALMACLDEPFPEDLFAALMSAKHSIEGFTPQMLLNKDLKRYHEGAIQYAIASIPPSSKWDIWDKECTEGLECLAKRYDLDYVMVLSSYVDSNGKRRKAFIVWSSCERLASMWQSHLGACQDLLGELLLSDRAGNVREYDLPSCPQRKVLQPLLRMHRLQPLARL